MSERVVNARDVHVEVVKMTSLWAIFEFSRLYLGYNALAAREPVRAQEVREEGSTSAKEALFRARGVGTVQRRPEFLVPGNQETTRPPGNSGKRKEITRKLP